MYSPSFVRDLPPNTSHYSRTRQHNALIALALALSGDPRFRDLKARKYFKEAECQKPTLAVVLVLSSLGTFYGSQGEQGLRYMYFGMLLIKCRSYPSEDVFFNLLGLSARVAQACELTFLIVVRCC